MSPERLFPLDGETSVRATFATDMFSFAMVIYEVRKHETEWLQIIQRLIRTDIQRPHTLSQAQQHDGHYCHS